MALQPPGSTTVSLLVPTQLPRVQSTLPATPPQQPAATSASAAPSTASLEQALDEMRAAIQPVARDLLFSVDEDTGKTVVKIVDSATDEVIRQIPSEEVLAIAKALNKLQGLLVQQQA
jgi:flagellar protein FlaG